MHPKRMDMTFSHQVPVESTPSRLSLGGKSWKEQSVKEHIEAATVGCLDISTNLMKFFPSRFT